jgi:acyl carrier protein
VKFRNVHDAERVSVIIDPRLREVFTAVLGVGAAHLSITDSAATLTNWDSLNHVTLMLALESEFGVQFNVDEIANLVSVAAIQCRLSGALNG